MLAKADPEQAERSITVDHRERMGALLAHHALLAAKFFLSSALTNGRDDYERIGKTTEGAKRRTE
jgi:hypothetical protein